MNYYTDPALAGWVNPHYLKPDTVEAIRQSVLARPYMRYAVLDNFFREETLGQLVAAHGELSFSEEADRRGADGSWLPYDGAVQFAGPHSVGAELFFHRVWRAYCAELVCATLSERGGTDVKLRYHRPEADGFWIHTDNVIRQVVAICYFNRGWRVQDGGLLQLWKPELPLQPDAFPIESPSGRMDFLALRQRIRTSTPGGGLPDGYRGATDFVLQDQVVPTYNRMFLCNFQTNPSYHSVTPSTGRARYGFVQWFL